MKYAITLMLLAMSALIGWATFQASVAPEPASFATLMPQGAVLFLEAKDFAGLWREWNQAPEKQEWLKSDNYEVFSRSRLFLRLEQAQKDFESAVGIPPDAAFLGQVAGQHSALAIYDIGKLELLYITRVPSAAATQSALWQQRFKFDPREAAGQKFFVRTEPQSERVVAFAIQGDYLVLGTREDLVAGAVSLLSGQKLAALSAEPWFAETVRSGNQPGDLRMVVHLAEVTKTPQFRTYWVQQNITAMRQYESAVTDLYRSAKEYREERVLRPKEGTAFAAAPEEARGVADLVRLAPPDIGVYRASAVASVDEVLALLEQKVLTPRLGPAPVEKLAPSVALGGGEVGSESNLDVRIDTAPSANTATKADEALRSLLTHANVRATLALHRTDPASDGVFVRLRSAVVVAAAAEWNEESARAAVQHLVAPALTTAQLGAGWRKAGNGDQSYSELDGLAPVVLAVRGHYLIVGNDAEMVAAALARLHEPVTAEPAVYAAAFNHGRERQNFYRLTALVDRAALSRGLPQENFARATPAEVNRRKPEFFSQNLGSLSRVFAGVVAQSVVVRRSKELETQTVRYEWTK